MDNIKEIPLENKEYAENNKALIESIVGGLIDLPMPANENVAESSSCVGWCP